MSFSSDLKEELSRIENLANKEAIRYELFGYIISSNIEEKKDKIIFSTESEYNINRFARLLSNNGIEDYDISFQGKIFTIKCPIVRVELNELSFENKKNVIRGIYLGSGSINNPENKYHLEMGLKNQEYADLTIKYLGEFNIKSN